MGNIIINENCQIHPSSVINSFSIIGKKFRPLLNEYSYICTTPTIIAEKVHIGHHVIIGQGSIIQNETIVDDYTNIENEVHIGMRCLIIYKAQICNEVYIGNDCIIGGFIGERVKIGNNCRVFGSIVHSQQNTLLNWDDENSMEKAPIIGNNVFIGFNSVISNNILIGNNSYVLPNSVISKNIPDRHIAYGINKIVPHEAWKGKLRESDLFKTN